MAIFRLVLFLGFFPLIASAITINPFSPKYLTATWDGGTAGSISNAGGAWNLDAANFTYDNGIKNSPFCQGCNVSFGAAAGGAAGVVTVTGIQKINNFTFNSGPTGNFTLTGGEISCVNFSPCTYTANYSGTIGSVISGSKDLIKQGPQTLTLSGINTYTGNTNVNAGTLEATTNVEAIPGNLIIAAGATGHLNVDGTKTFSNTISGQGTLKVTAGGTTLTTTTLSGNLSGLIGLFDIYPYPVGGGKINLTNTTQVNTPPIGSTIRLNNGATIYLARTLNYESNFELYGGTTGEALGQLRVENGTVTGPVTLFANSTIGTNGPTAFISGEISGPGFGFTKEGSGNITLTNNNTYTGTTVISAGTLQLGDGNKINNIIPATNLITDNAALVYNTPSNISHSGVISGTGSLNKQGNGTLTLTSNETYSGATTVNGGNLTLGAGGKLVTSGITVNNGGTMQFSGNTNSDNIGSGSMPITVNAGGLLSVTSTHSMGYNNLNNYANVTINGGTFNLTQNQYIGTLTLTDATVSGTGAVQFFFSVPTAINATTDSTISSPMNINAAAQTINVGAGATLSVSGNIGFNSGASGAITKSGTGNLFFSGTNTYTGNTTISGGTLQIGGAGSLGSGSYAGAISNSGTFQYSSSAAQTISGGITGAGILIKDTSTSILTLTGAGTFSGTTTVSNGTLKLRSSGVTVLAGPIINNSTLEIGNTLAGWVNRKNTAAGAISGTGNVIFNSNANTNSGNLNAVLDGGSVNLSHAFTDTGPISITNGNLVVENAGVNTSADMTISGASVLCGRNQAVTIGGLYGSGYVASCAGGGGNAVSIGNGNKDGDFSGQIKASQNSIDGSTGDGTINITKIGTGRQKISVSSCFTGTTTISGGILELVNADLCRTIINNATLIYNNSSDITHSGYVISGTGDIIKEDIGKLSVTTNNTSFTGSVIVNAGTFYCDYPSAVGSGITVKSGATLSLGDNTSGLNNWSAPLTFSGPPSGTNALLLLTSLTNLPDHTWSGTIALNTPTTFDTAHQVRPNYFTGIISGASPLTLISSGGAAFTFSGNSNYSGGTTIQSGTLRLNNTSGAGTGVINIGNGSLSLYRSGEPTTYANTITSIAGTTGFLNVDGRGSDAGVGVNSTYGTGAITVDGTLTIARPTGGNGHTYFTGNVNGAGTLKIDNTNGGVAPSGTTLGRGSFSGTFGFTGDVQVLAGGNFLANNVSVDSMDIASGGYWTLGANPATNMLTGSGTITTPASAGVTTLQVGGTSSSSSFSGVIGQTALGALGTVALNKVGTGTLTLSGANTYTGATTVTGGNLSFNPANTSIGSTSGITISGGSQVNLISGVGFNYTQNWVFSGTGGSIYLTQPSGAVNFTVSGTIALNGPGTIHGNKDQTTTISGLISGNSPLTLNSDNAHTNNFSLTGNNSYTGGTTIYNGGKVTCGHLNCLGTGTVTVNSGGTLNCNNFEITNGIIDNGGTIQNCRRTYLANGNFTAPTGVTSIQYLVVAGGGGGGGRGGANVSGAGGGGGGFLTGTVAVVPGNTYAITVGAGGAQSINNSPTRGGDSSIGALVTAIGGGGGGAGGGNGNQGASGGSGGGSVGNSLAGGAGTAGQGSIGGRGSSTNVGANVIGAGGGGGAGGAGGTGLTGPGNAPGGAGLSSSFSGAAVIYAAGGTGGDYPSSTNGANGAANRGDGGDGAGGNGLANGGSGGSGIVIILPY